ncbi:MAG: CHASE2 domain-containing protein, partial [Planctomycetota bacterium]|nr:CHASE2 domain-containing protein [Planctomycetota bacterium]
MGLLSRLNAKQKSVFFQACLGLLATVVVCALSFTDVYEKTELTFLDARFAFRKNAPAAESIVHVDIDDLSIDAIGRWPWNRNVHGQFIDTLMSLNPALIIFDVVFPDPSNAEISAKELKRIASQEITGRIELINQKLEELDSTIRMFLEDRSPVPVPVKDQLKFVLEWREKLSEEAVSLQAEVDLGLDKAKIDYDGEMAAAIARSGKVFLAYGFGEEETVVSDEDERLRSEIRGLLKQDLSQTPTMVANVLKIEPEKIVSILHGLKLEVAFETVEKELAAKPDLALKDLIASALPSAGLDETSADYAIIALAYRKVKARKLLVEKFMWQDKPDLAPQCTVSTAVTPPLYDFAAGLAGCGFADISRDPLDGKLREIFLFHRYNDRLALQLGFAAALRFLSVTEKDVVPLSGGRVELQNAVIPGKEGKSSIILPTSPRGSVLINWPPADWQDFCGTHASYAQVCQLASMRDSLVASMAFLGNSEEYGCQEQAEKWLDAWKRLGDARKASAEAKGDAQKTLEIEKEVEDLASQVAARVQEVVDKLSKTKAEFEKEPPERRRYAMIENLTKSIQAADKQVRSLQALASEEKNLTARLQKLVAGKICFVGSAHTGSTDLHPTPYSPAFPGVAIHTALLNMMLTDSFLYRTSAWLNFLIILLAGVITTAATMNRSAVTSSAISLGILVVLGAVGTLLFVVSNLWIDMVGPLGNTIVCFAALTAYRQLTTEREKRHVKNAFKHYVSPSVLEEIMREPTQLKLGGHRREVTVFVSDLQGFTTISETLPSEEIVNILNMYFSTVTPLIFDTEGTVDKYQGDGLMAFWGGPAEQRDHAMRSVLTALTYQEKMTEFRKQMLQKGYPDLRASIGLNTGVVIVGNMGCSTRMDYSIIGDNVNLAYRIEGVNREFKTAILIAESTYLSATEFVEAREIDYIRVKGRVKPTRLYELQARKGQLSALQTEVNAFFTKGLDYYRQRAW